MRVLAIDPGTLCGWALADDGRILLSSSGVVDLKPNRHEGGGMRFVRLDRWLSVIGPDLIVYEEVASHKGVAAAHVYGGIIATVQAWCETRKVPYTGVPVGTVKRHATGKGNSNKNAMVAAAVQKWGSQIQSHDHADALWILDWWLSQDALQAAGEA
jgi:Holliday junction resolvasome RuvABC endonuclease subunit